MTEDQYHELVRNWDGKATSLLGEQVDILLAHKGAPASDDPFGIAKEAQDVIVSGRLLAFSDGGDVRLEGDDGFVHHCWPALEVRPRMPISMRFPC